MDTHATAVDTPHVAKRSKSPARLLRDEAFQRWKIWTTDDETPSPVPKIYPDGMARDLIAATRASPQRVYRWLKDPDRHPLDWHELVSVAEEMGGTIRVMFSTKRT